MQQPEKIAEVIAKFNQDGNRYKTFAEFIAEIFTGKFLEIYLGDSFEEVKTEQQSNSYPAVFCGQVMGAFKECLILNSFHYSVDKGGEKIQSLGNIVFISERSIRALVEADGKGTINDLFMKSGKESLKVKEWEKRDE